MDTRYTLWKQITRCEPAWPCSQLTLHGAGAPCLDWDWTSATGVCGPVSHHVRKGVPVIRKWESDGLASYIHTTEVLLHLCHPHFLASTPISPTRDNEVSNSSRDGRARRLPWKQCAEVPHKFMSWKSAGYQGAGWVCGKALQAAGTACAKACWWDESSTEQPEGVKGQNCSEKREGKRQAAQVRTRWDRSVTSHLEGCWSPRADSGMPKRSFSTREWWDHISIGGNYSQSSCFLHQSKGIMLSAAYLCCSVEVTIGGEYWGARLQVAP